jgi:hypothetical protein
LRRTFCKEVNTLARKAGKRRVLGLYATALKCEQDKESKAKVVILSAVKKMQIEEKYDMLDSDNDVMLLDDAEISITNADV